MKTTAEKIDFLMKVTGTSNAALARELNFDASYISRIRSGKRGLPHEQPFIKPACTLFVKRVRDDYQRRALSDELGQPWPDRPAKARAVLTDWLETNLNMSSAVGRVVDALAEQPNDDMQRLSSEQPSACNACNPPETDGTVAQARLFFGIDGKRAGVISFLERLCDTGQPHTLLLHSDEDMTWLYDNASFARRWSALLAQTIENGSTIRVIHAITRDANEMWEAMRRWIPLYLTGSVESYYYPRLRDGIITRTLFIARGHTALISESVRGTHENMVNIMLDDPDAVTALEASFNDYLALCRQLVKISFPKDSAEMAALISPFAKAKGEMLLSHADDRLLCVTEDGGALMAALEPPRIAFQVDEPRMTATVWEYLRNLPEGSTVSDAEARKRLRALVDSQRD